MKVKICGLTRQQDIDAVNEAKPDFIGFVFAPSRRQVSADAAAAMKKRLDTSIQAVGVFVNAGIDDVVWLCQAGVIDFVQLHGDEDGDFIIELKKRIANPVVKAVRVQSAAQVLAAEKLPCDYLLLDTYQKDAYGGTGAAFDYALIPALRKPYFLAGGLSADNIAVAAAVGPFCLDVSSGVETDGVKDPRKIKELVSIVHRFK